MGKVLVAGDSFGEFAGYQNHFSSAGYAEPQQGYNYDAEFTHWCEQLAEDLNCEAVSHAIGGSGVSSNSYVAMQQLLTNQYNVCVFFVSHHERTIASRTLSTEQWATNVLPNIAFEEGSLDQIYNPEEHDLYRYYKYQYHAEGDQLNKPVITHINTQDVADAENTAKLLDIKEVTTNDLTYLQCKPAYSFVHDSVTGVLGLKALCEAKGIPIVFASCFSGGVMEAINNMGIRVQHFPFYDVEAEHGFDVRHDFPSHYNQQEHDHIYKKFKNSYPEFIKLYKQNY